MAESRYMVTDLRNPKRKPFEVGQVFADRHAEDSRFRIVEKSASQELIDVPPVQKKTVVDTDEWKGLTAKEFISIIKKTEDKDTLEKMFLFESLGKGRNSVLLAIEKQK